MRVQVGNTEINGASVAVRRHLTPITGTDVSPDERENVSELQKANSSAADDKDNAVPRLPDRYSSAFHCALFNSGGDFGVR